MRMSFGKARKGGFMVAVALTIFASVGQVSASAGNYPASQDMLVKKAWSEVSQQCRVGVQEVLMDYGFYKGPADGNLGQGTLAGIAAYVESGEELEGNMVSVDGIKGLFWHIGMDPSGCKVPE